MENWRGGGKLSHAYALPHGPYSALSRHYLVACCICCCLLCRAVHFLCVTVWLWTDRCLSITFMTNSHSHDCFVCLAPSDTSGHNFHTATYCLHRKLTLIPINSNIALVQVHLEKLSIWWDRGIAARAVLPLGISRLGPVWSKDIIPSANRQELVSDTRGTWMNIVEQSLWNSLWICFLESASMSTGDRLWISMAKWTRDHHSCDNVL